MNYYRRFPGDYLRDTMHLSAAEDGMYGRLLDAHYTSERPLPDDRKILYMLVRANTEQDKKAVESVLHQYFKKTRFGFVNLRAKKEFLRTQEISRKRISAGKSRANKAANAQQMLSKRGGKLDSRLQTLDSRPSSSVQSSQDHMAAAVHTSGNGTAAAFSAIGFDKPFGDRKFQKTWLEEFDKPAEWVTMKMESTIQRCQASNIGVPPQFFTAKHRVEQIENAEANARYKRTPL